MDQLIAPTKEDLKAIAKREYRQKQEAERKERIFNQRTRLIGIDKTALDKNVQEKQHQKNYEQNLEMSYALDFQRQNSELNNHLNKLNEERKRIQQEINKFRNQYQQKEQTREYDLNDPQYLRKTSPFQGFNWLGEDNLYAQRKQLQKKQQKSWLQQQMCEQNQVKNDLHEAERTMETIMLEHDARLIEIDQMEMKLRRQIQCNIAKYNFEMAREQKFQHKQKQRQNDEDNSIEIKNNLTSDMLMENKDIGISSSLFGGNRICGYMYRGMTDEQLQKIRQQQLQQIKEKNIYLNKNRENDKQYDEIFKMQCNSYENREREMQRQRQQYIWNQKMFNERLAEQQKQQNDYLNKEVYTFQPTEEYFQQFNTTSR